MDIYLKETPLWSGRVTQKMSSFMDTFIYLLPTFKGSQTYIMVHVS